MNQLDIAITLPEELAERSQHVSAPPLFKDKSLQPALNERIRWLDTDLYVAAKTWDLDRTPMQLTFHLALVK